jgi:hypothetical protein
MTVTTTRLRCRLVRVAGLAFLAKSALAVLLLIARGRCTRGRLLGAFTDGDSARLAAFASAMVALHATAARGLRAVRGTDDRLNAALSGAVGGLALALDAPSRRHAIALLLFVRAADAVVRAPALHARLPALRSAPAMLFGMCAMGGGRRRGRGVCVSRGGARHRAPLTTLPVGAFGPVLQSLPPGGPSIPIW